MADPKSPDVLERIEILLKLHAIQLQNIHITLGAGIQANFQGTSDDFQRLSKMLAATAVQSKTMVEAVLNGLKTAKNNELSQAASEIEEVLAQAAKRGPIGFEPPTK